MRQLGITYLFLAHVFTATAENAFGPITAERRRDFIERAQVWQPGDIAARDVLKGPDHPSAFAFDQAVACDFVPEKSGGTNPKFKCRLDDGRTIRVKFGLDNHEVSGEALGSRLLWLLGFEASRSYPIKVICRGCPANPHQPEGTDGKFYSLLHANSAGASAPPGMSVFAMPGTRVFYPALAKFFPDGPLLESVKNEGWRWPELDRVQPARGGAPLAHRDALKLLAAFMQHVDNSAGNQSLYCPEANVVPETEGRPATCSAPTMYISDIGSSFGTGARINLAKELVNYRGWKKQQIWLSTKHCVANIHGIFSIYHSSLNEPEISEEGRKFLAGLLAQVSDRQIEDLFKVGHVERMGPATIEDWKLAFKDKVRQIAEHAPCPPPSEAEAAADAN